MGFRDKCHVDHFVAQDSAYPFDSLNSQDGKTSKPERARDPHLILGHHRGALADDFILVMWGFAL